MFRPGKPRQMPPVSPAGLDTKPTGWRAELDWLRGGASVPRQQIIRDFGKSRAKPLSDIKNLVPQRRRAEIQPIAPGHRPEVGL